MWSTLRPCSHQTIAVVAAAVFAAATAAIATVAATATALAVAAIGTVAIVASALTSTDSTIHATSSAALAASIDPTDRISGGSATAAASSKRGTEGSAASEYRRNPEDALSTTLEG